jgi:hypothetical protein
MRRGPFADFNIVVRGELRAKLAHPHFGFAVFFMITHCWAIESRLFHAQ